MAPKIICFYVQLVAAIPAEQHFGFVAVFLAGRTFGFKLFPIFIFLIIPLLFFLFFLFLLFVVIILLLFSSFGGLFLFFDCFWLLFICLDLVLGLVWRLQLCWMTVQA